MNYESLIEDFEKTHKDLSLSQGNTYLNSIKSIKRCQKRLHSLRDMVAKHGFINQNDEIEFFKNIKSIPLSNYIYHKNVIQIETYMPRGDKSKQKRFIKKELKKIDKFFMRHIDFGHYIEMNYTHFDKLYFTRKSKAPFNSSFDIMYLEDSIFCTPKDVLLSEFKAKNKFIVYLKKKYTSFSNPQQKGIINTSLNWTGNKIDLIELIYALHSSGSIQNGIKDVAIACESLFDIELGNYYRKFLEIRNRKIERTKFINTLKTNLIQRMEDADV